MKFGLRLTVAGLIVAVEGFYAVRGLYPGSPRSLYCLGYWSPDTRVSLCMLTQAAYFKDVSAACAGFGKHANIIEACSFGKHDYGGH